MARNNHQRQVSHKISEHFSKRDFVCKCGVCNQAIKLSLGLIGGLELLRSQSRSRIQILKGYQCPDSSEKMGKVKRNFHVTGVAADIVLERKTLEETFLCAEQIPEFMGIGLNLANNYVHVDTRKDKNRVLWVVTTSGEQIPLTPENRGQFFPTSPAQNPPHETSEPQP